MTCCTKKCARLKSKCDAIPIPVQWDFPVSNFWALFYYDKLWFCRLIWNITKVHKACQFQMVNVWKGEMLVDEG